MDFFYEKFPRAETLFWKSGLFFDFFDLQILTKARLDFVLFLLFNNFFFFLKWILVPAREFFWKKKWHYA